MNAEPVAVRPTEQVAPRAQRMVGGAVMRARMAGAFGVLSVLVSIGGFILHGYPAMNASGKELLRWAITTDQQQFTIGIYIETLGTLLFLPFAAWLWSVARDAEGGSGWLSTAGFAAAIMYVGSIIDNGIWWAVLDAGRDGASIGTLAAIRDVAQHVFDTSLLFGGVFFALTGYVLFSTRAMPRWVGAVIALLGLLMLIPPVQIGGLVVWVLPVLLGLYLLIRPSAVAMVRKQAYPVADLTEAGAQ
jgi:hypothetical protein